MQDSDSTPSLPESWREKVARIIDGFAFSPKIERISGPDGPGSGWEDRRKAALAKADAIAALSPAPEGWRVVPVEPTEAMQHEGLECIKDGLAINDDAERTVRHAYRAMLSAAPLPGIGGRKDSGADVAADGAPVSEGRPTPLLEPSASLLCKLASIAVHADEMLGDDGHAFDRSALLSAFQDPEVSGWLQQMTAASLAPQKRKP